MTGRPAAGQAWSAEGYARHAGFVPTLGADVIALLAPRADEAILDIGCGDGALTVRLVEGGAKVTGLEPDPDMAAAARARGLHVVEQDAHEPFGEARFDAVFSNAALHWMRDVETVFVNAHRALKAGGRFAGESGGFGNVAAIVTAIRAALEASGATDRAGPGGLGLSPRRPASAGGWRRPASASRASRSSRARRPCRPGCAAGWRPSPTRSWPASERNNA